ncbi:hypothetical protein EZS27_020694 [termite gut metagenome]|uniref:Nucleotidyltransferase n=1 Tax=termite gut metagenome TaxID=433724 RepID=A0A5J4RCG6_9ZZZZ
MATEITTHLQDVLETHKMSHIDDLLTKYKSKRDEVKEKLEAKYNGGSYAPFNSGSYAKHTAINSKFDLDVVIPFKRNSFSTLEDMFNDVYDFLYGEYKNEATIREQKVSIGIEFYVDEDGDTISLDIVPGRELNADSYPDDDKLNLFVNSQYGLLESKTYIQTNIQAQIEHIKGKSNEREIIRLLKIWKNSNREKYKSFLLELITIKAFDKENILGNLWENLKAVMKYIQDNVTEDSFTLKDPGNSNNDVIETLEKWERQNLSNKMRNILSNIETNSDNINIYFPINEKYKAEEKSAQNIYGIKDNKIIPSIPPNNQRFG